MRYRVQKDPRRVDELLGQEVYDILENNLIVEAPKEENEQNQSQSKSNIQSDEVP